MNLETVHQLSLYELRRELTARHAWDLKDEEITYRNVLARAVALLVKEKEEKEQQLAATAPTTESVKERCAVMAQSSTLTRRKFHSDTSQDMMTACRCFRLEREKEERKKAALERSKQRQAQPGYFKAKMESNKATIVQPKKVSVARSYKGKNSSILRDARVFHVLTWAGSCRGRRRGAATDRDRLTSTA